ncbi:hypothetical protein PUN28_013675 [Cardiocondyla obscurior]|uniref:Uncharacterized protein n=1 Tax=Cardiocondyla obscurior TaxID=286306 RepID=A0AAW2F659_9HYME
MHDKNLNLFSEISRYRNAFCGVSSGAKSLELQLAQSFATPERLSCYPRGRFPCLRRKSKFSFDPSELTKVDNNKLFRLFVIKKKKNLNLIYNRYKMFSFNYINHACSTDNNEWLSSKMRGGNYRKSRDSRRLANNTNRITEILVFEFNFLCFRKENFNYDVPLP